MMEHIFRELAGRGIDPFGYGEEDSEDEWSDGDDDESSESSSNDPIEIAVRMTDGAVFVPDEIEVQTGRPVHLTIENAGQVQHDFTIDEILSEISACEGDSTEAAPGDDEQNSFDIHLALDGGSTGTLEFTPMEAGVYVFHCTGEGHDESGMTGTLIVS